MDYFLNLKNNLKELRLLNNYTQKYVADFLEVTEKNYQNFEYGKTTPRLSNLIKLADLYNVSIDSLLGRKID